MPKQHFDLIVRNATVTDGTKAPRYGADIGVRDGRIAEIGMLVGHTMFRVATMDRLDRVATPAELAQAQRAA